MFSWVGKLHFNCKGCWRMNESEGFSTYSSIDQCSHWNTFYLQSVRRKSWKRNRKWKCFRLVTRRSDLWLEYWIGRHWWFTSLFFTRTWQCGVCQCNWWLGFWVSLRFNYLLFKKFIVAVILKYFSRIMFLKVLDFFCGVQLCINYQNDRDPCFTYTGASEPTVGSSLAWQTVFSYFLPLDRL